MSYFNFLSYNEIYVLYSNKSCNTSSNQNHTKNKD